MTELYYARWNSGEVDIVHLNGAQQIPSWAVEVKWSDRPYRSRSELDNCVELVNRNPTISQPILVTSRTIADTDVFYKGVRFNFCPASLYAYMLGANLLRQIGTTVSARRAPKAVSVSKGRPTTVGPQDA